MRPKKPKAKQTKAKVPSNDDPEVSPEQQEDTTMATTGDETSTATAKDKKPTDKAPYPFPSKRKPNRHRTRNLEKRLDGLVEAHPKAPSTLERSCSTWSPMTPLTSADLKMKSKSSPKDTSLEPTPAWISIRSKSWSAQLF